MGKTAIEWATDVWNPTRGCSRVSEGCRHCYAERFAARFRGPGQRYEGLVKTHPSGEPRWTGKVRLVEEMISVPLGWRKPRRIFVNSMSDLFHESLEDHEIAQVFAMMQLAHWHTYLVLTKRAERMRTWMLNKNGERCTFVGKFGRKTDVTPVDQFKGRWPLPNVWLGVSVEDQETGDGRIPHLLEAPAAVRFVSYEPALGPVDFWAFLKSPVRDASLAELQSPEMPGLDLVIVGGESGPGARPCDVAWIRSVVEQCKAVGAACFVKQLGAHPHDTVRGGRPVCRAPRLCNGFGDWHRSMVLRDRKGGDMEEWPEDLRVRELPEVRG